MKVIILEGLVVMNSKLCCTISEFKRRNASIFCIKAYFTSFPFNVVKLTDGPSSTCLCFYIIGKVRKSICQLGLETA